MKTLLRSALLCCIVSGAVFGQEAKYPFPQNITYPFGVMPTQRDTLTNHLKKWYDAWKTKYLQECSGNLRPGVDPLTKSLVEAQGFAMIAVAYMGDKAIFDKLYAYYKSKCTNQACGMMDWKQTCGGNEGNGSATDGDVDVACGLIVAHWQWPDGGYADKAKGVMTNLKKMLVDCGEKKALAAGCAGSPWGGCNETDISYYEPAFFRYFAEVSGDAAWAKLADDTHLIRDAAANATTGLVPDWQSVSGTAGSGSRKAYYSFDAIRVPYKQTLDYLWHGNEKALAWCKKISTWAYGVGPKNIVDGYQLNGSAQGSSRNMAVEGSLAVAAMSNTQEVLDAFVTEALAKKDDYWYSGYLGNLYMLALSGNMWCPKIVGPTATMSRGGNHSGSAALQLTTKITADRRLSVTGLPRGSVIALTSLDGRTILTSATTTGRTALSLDVSDLRSGCYIVRVVAVNGRPDAGRIVSIF